MTWTTYSACAAIYQIPGYEDAQWEFSPRVKEAA